MNFNTTNFKPWKRSDIKPTEMANYDGYIKDNKGTSLKDVIIVFDSALSLVDHLYHNAATIGNGTWTADNISYGGEWRYGKDFPTLEDTTNVLRSGKTLPKYLNKLEQKKHELFQKYPELYELNEKAVVKKRRRRFSEEGDELDIDRYMCGDPAMWSSMPRQDVTKRCATFFINLDISAGTSTELLIDGMIEAAALVDIVEKAGIPTEIVVGGVTNKGTPKTRLLTVCCKAKHADEPLDIERLLSFCAVGFYRAFIFNAWENTTEGQQSVNGLGNGSYNYTSEPEYFDFFNAVVKTRTQDAYWNNKQTEVNINNIRKFLN